MPIESTFTIYNASAGSGKTHTIVKEYLKILLKSKSFLAFKSVLALTFTNKAVAEMKERIIRTLQEFSDKTILTNPSVIFSELTNELGIERQQVHEKSKVILETIVHNYASFDISTIDKFNHKLIRTFAHDLKLPLNFEVELDTLNLLSKAVDILIDSAGTDKALTKVLIDFALEKADDDKSWDISYDFNAIAKLLINENEIPYLNALKFKTLDDFKLLKFQLSKTISLLEAQIVKISKETIELIMSNGLQIDDFSSSYLPKYFQKLTTGNLEVKFGLKWQLDLEDAINLYPKRVSSETASIIDSIQPLLAQNFITTHALIIQNKFQKNALKNITPLSVLNAINNSLETIKKEDDLLLISEFNSLISNEIKNQPAPFIYERIGEKFKHFFIDEFQDTSQLQWENMIPLIDNALSGENLKGVKSSAMIVGDAKQAIYRWRGGKAEQFINLYNKHARPFVIEQNVRNLPANYRSLKQIVFFNNSFFKHVSHFVFSNKNHQSIYQNSFQEYKKEKEGFVAISFLDVKNLTEDENKDLLHCQKVLETIQTVQKNGFDLSDICIITRKTKEGVAIAEYLSSEHIPIISSESLLLKNSPDVNFITSIFSLAVERQNDSFKIELLSYLAEFQLHLEDKHAFFSDLIRLTVPELFQKLSDFGFYFDYDAFLQLSLYDSIESIVRAFSLNQNSNAYLQFFMEEVLDYSIKHDSSFSGFLGHWEQKKDNLSVIAPQGNSAVQIMTIHKSKGLEFPVVIFPYANQDIYFDMSPKTWFPVEKEDYNGFSHLFINLNNDIEEFDEKGATIYNDYRAELELDTINLLYVVMTRAIEQLYIISELDLDSKQNEKLNLYSGLLINYLKSIQLWDENQVNYTIGNPLRQSFLIEKKSAVIQRGFICTAKETHNLAIVTNAGYLWDTAQEKAQEKGNLVHDIMSQILTVDDAPMVINDFYHSGKINLEQKKELYVLINIIVTHHDLQAYYTDGLTIYNEIDIITKEGEILRPDRIVVINAREVVLIDYKTGNEKPGHLRQLSNYQMALEEMNFEVIKKILIYINEDIHVKEF